MFDPQHAPEHIVDQFESRFNYLTKAEMASYPQSTDTGTGVDNESRRSIMPMSPLVAPPPGSVQRTGRWTPDEKILFLYGLKRFGKGRWKKMSVYLPHRSLVQIKSHAQKVLKRMEAGENVFNRLDENYHIVDTLVVQAARQHEALSQSSTTPKSNAARRKKQAEQSSVPNQMHSGGCSAPQQPPVDSDVAALAASALCQLSSLS